MSSACQKAIIARFDGDVGVDSVYTAVGGRLWYERAKETETTPYIVFRIVDDAPDRTFADDLPTWRVQFDIYDEDPEPNTVNDVAWKLQQRFNRCDLTYVDGHHTAVGCVRDMTLGPMREGEYWRVTMDFLVTAQET